MIILTTAIFFLGAVVSFFFQVWIGRSALEPRKFLDYLQIKDWISGATGLDVLMTLVTKALDRLMRPAFRIGSISVSMLVAAGLNGLFPHHPKVPVTVETLILFSVIMFLILDFSVFFEHYLLHAVPILWEFHKVHHAATIMTPLTVNRAHPVGNLFEAVASAVVMCLPVGVIIAMTDMTYVDIVVLQGNATLIGSILILEELKHSPFKISYGVLDRYICSPMMHQVHHSYLIEHWDRNFGNKLSIWDRAFGTFHQPEISEHTPFGLGGPEEKDYHTPVGAYVTPFIRIAAMVKRHSAAKAGAARGGAPVVGRLFWRPLGPDPAQPQS
jgi:sterol desaturase/sphingolipid hydroxylase (fatty acid hydroxylase superfamily)